jgi:hypothetical protein
VRKLARGFGEDAIDHSCTHPFFPVQEFGMSTTNTQDTYLSENRAQNRAGTTTSRSTRVLQETKPSPKTTELWFMVAGIAALFVIYNAAADTSLDLFRACLLGIVLASAYIVSRGLSKAGSHDDYEDTNDFSGRR